jgi:sugar O-acyltransferase (sialic acid O-acetyltransferase NeuD family)
MHPAPIVIIGIGGHALEVACIIDHLNSVQPQWNLLGFVDPIHSGKQEHYGLPVLGDYASVAARFGQPFFACGMAAPAIRIKESKQAESLAWPPATLIHPSVIQAKFISIGEGTTIAAGCILGPYVQIGRHCLISAHVSIGHNACVGDFSVIYPGARVNGNVIVEDQVFIGSNASVQPKCRIGSGATLGANTFLSSDLAPGRKAIGGTRTRVSHPNGPTA